jgi:hypothetical protein
MKKAGKDKAMANAIIWTLQVLLALHTLIGAGWKIMNSAPTIPSLAAIPQGIWIALIAFEVLCAIGLVIPAVMRSLGYLVPIAAAGIAAEMFVFGLVGRQSGVGTSAEIAYWLGVAVVCGLVIVGRVWIAPHQRTEKAA